MRPLLPLHVARSLAEARLNEAAHAPAALIDAPPARPTLTVTSTPSLNAWRPDSRAPNGPEARRPSTVAPRGPGTHRELATGLVPPIWYEIAVELTRLGATGPIRPK